MYKFKVVNILENTDNAVFEGSFKECSKHIKRLGMGYKVLPITITASDIVNAVINDKVKEIEQQETVTKQRKSYYEKLSYLKDEIREFSDDILRALSENKI